MKKYGMFPPWREHLLRRYLQCHHQRPGKYLDVGCGRGDSLAVAMSLGYFTQGVEVVDYLCVPPTIILVEGAHDMPFEDNKFDVVTCMDVMEHIPEEDVDLVIAEIARVGKECLFGISYRSSIRMDMELHVTRHNCAWWAEKMICYYKEVHTRNKDVPDHIVDYFGLRCWDAREKPVRSA